MKLFKSLLLTMLLLIGSHSAQAKTDKQLLLATTSSVHNSGLLDILLQNFEKQTNIVVKATIQGSGLAITSAINGNADIILTHAPEIEKEFVASGYGVKRYPFMSNQFVIVGPIADDASIHQQPPLQALSLIANGKHKFVSRGDNSGTHEKELELWQELGIIPQVKKSFLSFLSSSHWYIQAGAGMGQSLTIAFEKNAYILSDYGTWLRYKNRMQDFTAHVHNHDLLNNQYSVIAVNPNKHPYVQHELAQQFIAFLTGKQGQKIIANYKINGEPLFVPNALSSDAD